MSNRCSDPFSTQNAPAGSDTARVFPWWQTGVVFGIDTPELYALTAGQRFRFRPLGPPPGNPYLIGGAPLFNNPMSWPIYITEIRFLCMSVVVLESPYEGDYEDLGRQVGIRFSTTQQGDIIKEFVPMSSLNTDPTVAQEMQTTSAVVTLPADYFMPSDVEFGANLNIFAPTVLTSDAQMQVGIRGCDPYNHSPVARFSEYQDVAYDANKTGSEFRISGNAGGQALRNMWMRDLTLAMDDPFSRNLGGDFWHQVNIKVQPPQGPKWSTDSATPIVCIADQVSVGKSSGPLYGEGRRSTIVSHKPVTPYVLLPQDRLDIEGIFYSDMSYTDKVPMTILWATVRGYQEAPDVG